MTIRPVIPPLLRDAVAEMAVLGALIVAPKVLPEVRRFITVPEAFDDERHASIYAAILEAYAEEPEADLVLVQAKLTQRGVLEQCGGHEYLMRLANEVPSGAGAPVYARIVAECHGRRTAAESAMEAARVLDQQRGDDAAAAQLERALAALRTVGAPTPEVPIARAVASVKEGLLSKAETQLPTGLARFDEAFGGIPAVGVVTVLGVPGAGKSALASNIVVNTAVDRSVKWRIFSFEVGAEQSAQNMLSMLSQVPIADLRRRRADPAAHESSYLEDAARRLEVCDIAFVETSLTADAVLRSGARYAAGGVRAFVIDYAQNIAPAYPEQPERERIAALMRGTQELARVHRACVLVVSQPTLDACREDRPLRASDVKGGQELWAGSDMVISVYRSAALRGRQADESDEDWQERRRQAQLHVVKHKTGPTGMVHADFRPEILRFSA